MHSPFVFEFITKVLNDKKKYPEYKKVEKLRRTLLKDKKVLTVEDMGAGSVKGSAKQRTIAAIAGNAAKPPKYGQLLFRMVKHYQPQTILELGTSLGITTAYLSLARLGARIITMEGAAAIADKAVQNFTGLQLDNIDLIRGNFDETLFSAISQAGQIDLAFIDGNHRREPTERYFEQLLPATHNDSILVFDDIHWSREMEQAWQTIQQHEAVRCTIDLFFVGIVLLRGEFREKQHFSVRF